MNKPTDYWRGVEVEDFTRKQDLVVPRKDELLSTIVTFLPYPENSTFEVVDLGAGIGDLSEKILERFPKATVTSVDISPDMVAVMRNRFESHGNRSRVLLTDFNSSTWRDYLPPVVDAVVSSLALHYLATKRREHFFREIFDLLKSPGCFIDGTGFSSEDPHIQRIFDEEMVQYTHRRLQEKENRTVPVEQIRQNYAVESAKAGINRDTLENRLNRLRQAGFSNVDVVWRFIRLAVVMATKREAPATPVDHSG